MCSDGGVCGVILLCNGVSYCIMVSFYCVMVSVCGLCSKLYVSFRCFPL